MLKIKDNIDLKELEKYGFIYDSGDYNILAYNYEFLLVKVSNRQISICSGVDEINGDTEILKLYDLIKDGLVEKDGE